MRFHKAEIILLPHFISSLRYLNYNFNNTLEQNDKKEDFTGKNLLDTHARKKTP